MCKYNKKQFEFSLSFFFTTVIINKAKMDTDKEEEAAAAAASATTKSDHKQVNNIIKIIWYSVSLNKILF